MAISLPKEELVTDELQIARYKEKQLFVLKVILTCVVVLATLGFMVGPMLYALISVLNLKVLTYSCYGYC
jgi:hypothetical protein